MITIWTIDKQFQFILGETVMKSSQRIGRCPRYSATRRDIADALIRLAEAQRGDRACAVLGILDFLGRKTYVVEYEGDELHIGCMKFGPRNSEILCNWARGTKPKHVIKSKEKQHVRNKPAKSAKSAKSVSVLP